MMRNAHLLTTFLVILLLTVVSPAIDEKDLLGDYPLAPGVTLTLSPHSSIGMVSAKITGREPFLFVERECCHYDIPEIGGEARFGQMKKGGHVSLRLDAYDQTVTAWKAPEGTDASGAVKIPKDPTERLKVWVPVWMIQHNVPGVSIALIRNRRIVRTMQFGLKKAGRPGRVDEDSVFEACSMSKPLFAYAVLKLVEQKKLNLDRPLDSYLPEPYLPDEPEAGRITTRMVLNHTTGLPNWRKGGRHAKMLTLRHKPGERFIYSGEGMWYLQRVVEQITGKPINEYMTETLMSRIGMDRSSYVWQERYPENYAHGHNKAGKPNNYRYYTDGNTAFSLYTTPADYARYLILMMDTTPEEDFQISAGTLNRMLTPESRRSEGVYYGLGWAIGGPDGARYVYHGGSNGSGFRCHARFYRRDGSGIVVMTNATTGATLYNKVLDQVYP